MKLLNLLMAVLVVMALGQVLYAQEEEEAEWEVAEEAADGEALAEEEAEEGIPEEDLGGEADLGEAEAAEAEAAAVVEEKEQPWDPDYVEPWNVQGEKWTLDFDFRPPQPIWVVGPCGEEAIYWYMLYTVTNNTGAKRLFTPNFLLFTDEAVVHRAGMYPRVYEAIKKTRRVEFLESPAEIIGDILEGEDNARDGVAIFGPISQATRSFTIFVGGLSGEYVLRDNAAAKPDAPETEKKFTLYKSLAIEYKLSRQKWEQAVTPVELVKKWWTWR